MCLYTVNKSPFVAEKDIVCYKMLDRTTIGDYVTPYRQMRVEVPCTIHAAYLTADPKYDIEADVYSIGGQGVHAYTDLDDARMQANRSCYHLARCVIPAGTEYWLGDDSDIAAKQMQIEEIIYPNKL